MKKNTFYVLVVAGLFSWAHCLHAAGQKDLLLTLTPIIAASNSLTNLTLYPALDSDSDHLLYVHSNKGTLIVKGDSNQFGQSGVAEEIVYVTNDRSFGLSILVNVKGEVTAWQILADMNHQEISTAMNPKEVVEFPGAGTSTKQTDIKNGLIQLTCDEQETLTPSVQWKYEILPPQYIDSSNSWHPLSVYQQSATLYEYSVEQRWLSQSQWTGECSQQVIDPNSTAMFFETVGDNLNNTIDHPVAETVGWILEKSATLLRSPEYTLCGDDSYSQYYQDQTIAHLLRVQYGADFNIFSAWKPGFGKNPEETEIDNCSGTCSSGSQTVLWQGREWQRCDDGNEYSWEDAKTYCQNLVLAGHTDWQLPTKDALKDLVLCTNGKATPLKDWDYPGSKPYEQNLTDATCCDNYPECNSYSIPTIDPQFTGPSATYWSSSPYASGYAWFVNFIDGHAYWDFRQAVLHVRCVH